MNFNNSMNNKNRRRMTMTRTSNVVVAFDTAMAFSPESSYSMASAPIKRLSMGSTTSTATTSASSFTFDRSPSPSPSKSKSRSSLSFDEKLQALFSETTTTTTTKKKSATLREGEGKIISTVNKDKQAKNFTTPKKTIDGSCDHDDESNIINTVIITQQFSRACRTSVGRRQHRRSNNMDFTATLPKLGLPIHGICI